jgi:hypothetical protein
MCVEDEGNYTSANAKNLWRYYKDKRSDVRIFKLKQNDIGVDNKRADKNLCIAVQKKSKLLYKLKNSNKLFFINGKLDVVFDRWELNV